MKKIFLVSIVVLGLGACQNSNNSTPATGYGTSYGTVAATPQTPCGTTIPYQYCTAYNPGAYGYTGLNYGTYGYGYYGSSGFAGYGCPVGYQPLYLGTYASYGSSSYTCVMNTYFSGYNSGYVPYYANGQRWANHMGHGPAQACTVGTACPRGNCLAFGSGNLGYCAR